MVQWSMQSAGLRIPSISAIIAEKKIRINAGADSVRTGSRGLALIRPCACAVTRSMIVHYTTKFLRKPGLSGGSYQILIDQEACLPGQPTVALACSWRTREVRIPAPPGCAGVLPACSDAIHDGGAGITLSTALHGAGCPRSATTGVDGERTMDDCNHHYARLAATEMNFGLREKQSDIVSRRA